MKDSYCFHGLLLSTSHERFLLFSGVVVVNKSGKILIVFRGCCCQQVRKDSYCFQGLLLSTSQERFLLFSGVVVVLLTTTTPENNKNLS